ncbi:unnamed protein product [Somion occarium]|uniref:Uncharacterized protein n=1 Tax=Somion occarium TaxID=3059160 RepID=A0ABP1D1P4_9APHY
MTVIRSSLLFFAVSTTLFTNAMLTLPRDVSTLTKRQAPQGVLIGCYSGGAGGCPCPIDNFGDEGLLINVFPGYQCAYPEGACSWSDKNGELQNAFQDNCQASAPCPPSGCTCPLDLNNDEGVLINYFTGYQCAYPNGACTWDDAGTLTNTRQGNCPKSARCNQFRRGD